jgi:replicative superfamily II helicase
MENTLQYHEERGLPTGAKKKIGLGFEEVEIPAFKKVDVPNEGLVEISFLENWAQLAFAGTKRLNRIQSEVFDIAYNSAENMLVCAPTGAGKTNIAMLTFLQLLKQNIRIDTLDKTSVKAIYIAPMKALAQEVDA